MGRIRHRGVRAETLAPVRKLPQQHREEVIEARTRLEDVVGAEMIRLGEHVLKVQPSRTC